MHIADVLITPLVTEKSTILNENRKYVFKVNLKSTKIEIARAIEWAFNVHVIDVNTIIVKGKNKAYRQKFSKRPNWKKAIVSLRYGESIQLFEGA